MSLKLNMLLLSFTFLGACGCALIYCLFQRDLHDLEFGLEYHYQLATESPVGGQSTSDSGLARLIDSCSHVHRRASLKKKIVNPVGMDWTKLVSIS